VATARLHWQEAVRTVADSHRRRPATLTDEERAGYRLSLALSGEAAEQAVRLTVAGSGGSAYRLSHPLQRIQRDVNVLLPGLGFTVTSF
jgi:GTP cyclohydrolase II